MERRTRKIKSGVVTLDTVVGGGLPLGSFVVLLGESGSGHREFVYSTAIMTSLTKGGLGESTGPEVALTPEEVCYISLSKTREDILTEVYQGHTTDLAGVFEENVLVEELDKYYYQRISALSEGSHRMDDGRKGEEESPGTDLPTKLQEIFDKRPKHCMVVMDDLTDLSRLYPNSPDEFIFRLLAMRKATKKMEGLTYAILDKDTLKKNVERTVSSVSDGVLTFKWREAGSAMRQRIMYVEKFSGILTYIGDDVPIFDVSLSPQIGFNISKLSKIRKVA